MNSNRHELSSALQILHSKSRNAFHRIDAERLAWAVAFNADELSLPEAVTSAAKRGGGGYARRWPPEMPWANICRLLTSQRIHIRSGGTYTFLSELAISVACEQRSDWQNPSSRPVKIGEAIQAFDFVYADSKAIVLGMCGRLADRVRDPEDIANEAWARVFEDYWSTRARRRFLGLSRISTMVCTVARNISTDSIREGSKFPVDEGLANEYGSPIALEIAASDIGPEENLIGDQLKLRIKECMERLTARQKVVAHLLWSKNLKAKSIAKALEVTEEAVSEHKKKARISLRACLGEHGFNVPL